MAAPKAVAATTSHGGSESGSSQASAQFNDADVTYAEGMIMHHQQAVEMSDIILDKSGVNPDVVEMAKQMKKAQGPEIKEMQTWVKDWGQDDSGHEGHGGDSGSGDEMSHDGMVSPEDIKKLKAADGEQASVAVPRPDDRAPPRRREDGQGPPPGRGEPRRGGAVQERHQRPERRDQGDADLALLALISRNGP